NITDYKEREITAPEIIQRLDNVFSDYDKADISVAQIDVGPPPAQFAVRINSTENREDALALSHEIAEFLENTDLKRLDGSLAKIENATAGVEDIYERNDNKQ